MSVVVRGLTKRYRDGSAPAVADVSFEAPRGAITSLIGPSGAGKSTLLRLVAGLEVPDAGTIRIDDEDVTTRPVQRRGVGLVFQSYALFENMSVKDNVAFGLDVRRPRVPRDEIDARVHRLLKLVQLEGYAARLPAQLSGGQRQRVAFARALAIEPKVLLLDEPFGALDARVRKDLRDWLLRLHDETHVTTLLVTHDQDEALEASQHVVVLLDGTVAQAGPPHEVYDQPRSAATAAFLGARRLSGVPLPNGASDGFVRPADLRLLRPAPEQGDHVALAQLERAKIVGARAKVLLRLRSNGAPVEVDVARDEFDALGVSVGDVVLLDVRAARVFVEDFTI